MSGLNDINEQVKRANREVYNAKTVEGYNQNESIFNEKRRLDCETKLSECAALAGNDMYLDVGAGTGNLLRIALPIFKRCHAIDIGDELLARVKPSFPEVHLVAADGEFLPFASNSFNVVSCYAMLHHLFRHDKLFEECLRVLRKGGVLYTDHDPNYFLNRFYRIIYKLRFAGKCGFGSEVEDLAEYYNAKAPGINPSKLKRQLLEAGFKTVEISYRITDKPNQSHAMSVATAILKATSAIVPLKSFFTHFSIKAIK